MEQTSAQPTEIGTFLFSYDCEKGSVRCLFAPTQEEAARKTRALSEQLGTKSELSAVVKELASLDCPQARF